VLPEAYHETYLPTFQSAPRADARVSRPDENGRRPQGSVGSSRQGPRAPVGLTHVASHPRVRHARYRLRGAGAFETIFGIGVRLDAHFLQLIAAPAAQEPGRVGYVIGRKAMPRAVDRNRLRRRLRAILAAARPSIERFDLIVRVKRVVQRDDIARVVMESRTLLARLAGPAA